MIKLLIIFINLKKNHLWLNMIELGTVKHHVLTLNVSYMQVHPTMDSAVLPLGVSQFKKMFKKMKNYPI
uniref:Uncharacterized protein n=1 Tax=Heterorhabditis bacteriophora TaxID=37862 RepID=A0A1I7WJM4_HETBA